MFHIFLFDRLFKSVNFFETLGIVIAFSLVYRIRTLPNYKEFRTPLHGLFPSAVKKKV